MKIITRMLTLTLLIFLIACDNLRTINPNKEHDFKNSSTESLIIEYPNPNTLDLSCKEIALNFYRIHDVKVSKFYEVWNKLGYDFNDGVFTLQRDFDSGNNRKVYSRLFFFLGRTMIFMLIQ